MAASLTPREKGVTSGVFLAKPPSVLNRDSGFVTDQKFAQDMAAVQQIDVVPTILDTVCSLTGMGFAAVARVTESRWTACSVKDEIAFGLESGGELEVETTICHEVRAERRTIAFNNADEDPTFATHPTPARYGLKSYISTPIFLPDGSFFGTLCAIDPHPRSVDRPEVLDAVRMFASLIGYHLGSLQRLAEAEADLLVATDAAELREQFIAVLGHDLRNPLASIEAGLQMLESPRQESRSAEIRQMMRRSVARMNELIANILDFARGRLGGGFDLQIRRHEVRPLVDQLVNEVKAVYPNSRIEVICEEELEADWDPGRAAQMLSNLLGNAVSHGGGDKPVELECRAESGVLVISVSNEGADIPQDRCERLFQPFVRGDDNSGGGGLGLGLYISDQIARAHGGAISVVSQEGRTTFRVGLPRLQISR